MAFDDEALTEYNFSLEIVGGGVEGLFAFFRHCSGLEVRFDVLEYHEGGNNAAPHQLPGQVHYPNLVLSKGMTYAQPMMAWLEETMTEPARKEIVLEMRSALGQGQSAKWTVVDGFPVSWTGPQFNADGARVATESLEIAHSGLKQA